MPGYSAVLPLTIDPDDGLALNKTYANVAKQNFKMLLLTVPGEKIMDPEFGVGLPRFFFENITPETLSKIDSRIRKQTGRYLPFINVLKMDISGAVNKLKDPNTISVYIEYEIESINMFDWIRVDFDLSPDMMWFHEIKLFFRTN